MRFNFDRTSICSTRATRGLIRSIAITEDCGGAVYIVHLFGPTLPSFGCLQISSQRNPKLHRQTSFEFRRTSRFNGRNWKSQRFQKLNLLQRLSHQPEFPMPESDSIPAGSAVKHSAARSGSSPLLPFGDCRLSCSPSQYCQSAYCRSDEGGADEEIRVAPFPNCLTSSRLADGFAQGDFLPPGELAESC